MFQILKKVVKYPIFIVNILVIIVLFLCVCIYKNADVSRKIKINNAISFSVLLYGTEKMFPGRLDLYTALYDKKNNILKVLFINTDTVVFRNCKKVKSIKMLFNEYLKKKQILQQRICF
ncbi:MAG: hypothetical protein LBS47_01085 [Endomicrobium sp.]|jgi:hypothetical protein|nr:hypothetical protein [Endomicrobium sp.]